MTRALSEAPVGWRLRGFGLVQLFVRGQVVVFAERIEAGAVDGKEREAGGQCVEFVEVDREQKNAIQKAMRLGCKPVVHHPAFIKAGLHAT